VAQRGDLLGSQLCSPQAAAKRLKTHANEGEDCYKSEVEARRKANTLTPKDIHFLRMEEAMEKNTSVGKQQIVGIEGIESDGDCESEEDSDPEGRTVSPKKTLTLGDCESEEDSDREGDSFTVALLSLCFKG
jgi:hypothetical protein